MISDNDADYGGNVGRAVSHHQTQTQVLQWKEVLANHLPRFLSPQLQFYLEEEVKGEGICRERDLHFLCRDESSPAVRVGEVEDSQLQIVLLQRMELVLVLQPTTTHPYAPVRAQSSLLNSHAPINMTASVRAATEQVSLLLTAHSQLNRIPYLTTSPPLPHLRHLSPHNHNYTPVKSVISSLFHHHHRLTPHHHRLTPHHHLLSLVNPYLYLTLKRVTMVMLCSKNHFQSYLHKAVRQVWIQLNNLKICHSLPYTSCPRWMRYTGPTFLP
jgi:hypothetical protein